MIRVVRLRRCLDGMLFAFHLYRGNTGADISSFLCLYLLLVVVCDLCPLVCRLLSPRSTTVFSHAQTVVQCGGCMQVLCQPTGGKARLTEGCSFRKKAD